MMGRKLVRFTLPLVLALSAVAAVPPGAVLAATGPRCYVDVNVAAGEHNGNSWGTAFDNLIEALTDSNCTEIWVAQGLYLPGVAEGSTFLVASGVAVYGGFDTSESMLSQRDPAANVTILSGDIDGDDTNTDANSIAESTGDIVGDNAYHVLTMDGGSTSVTSATIVDGFVITAGDARGTVYTSQVGGGLYCDGSGSGALCSPTLSNLTFSGNFANIGGGAIYNDGFSSGESSPSITNVTFRGNRALWYGGAIYNDGSSAGTSSPALANVTFFQNSAPSVTVLYGLGGAIYSTGANGVSSPIISNATFAGNSAGTVGGGIYFEGSGGASSATLTNVIFWENVAPSGPAVFNSSATPTISYSVVQGTCAAISGATCGTGNLSSNPSLGTLADNGGWTQTMALGASSPAIDAGHDPTCAGVPVSGLDQRSVARPQGSSCDIGSYEFLVADTIGINGSGTFYLRDANAAGPADNTFGFGWAGPTPLVGDWDGDGIATIGIDDGGWFFLRNTNSPGSADSIYQYGWSSATPLMGDWDGDGIDTVGIYGDGWFFLRNSNSPGPADMTFSFGWVGPTPIVGDWDGDGIDTIGIHAGDTFFLRNTNSSGAADVTFSYGWAGPTPLVGDWDGDGMDTIGIVSSGTFYLRNANSAGPADLTFGYGWGGATVLAGTWDLIP